MRLTKSLVAGVITLALLSACATTAFVESELAQKSVITKSEKPAADILQKFGREYKILQDNGLTQETLENENGKLWYCQGIYGADQPGKFAVLVFLHGLGERGEENLAQLRLAMPEIVKQMKTANRKVIVLAPECPSSQYWAPLHRGGEMGDTMEKPYQALGMIPTLIEKKIKEFNADADRVYITGLSMGGYGTWDLIARYGTDVFAAAMPCCGGGDPKRADKMKDLPIYIFHGGADPTVPVQLSRYIFNSLKKAGSTTVFYKEYPGVDHNSWDRTYANKENWDWLFSQKRGVKSANVPAQDEVQTVTDEQYAAGFGFNGGPKSANGGGFRSAAPGGQGGQRRQGQGQGQGGQAGQRPAGQGGFPGFGGAQGGQGGQRRQSQGQGQSGQAGQRPASQGGFPGFGGAQGGQGGQRRQGQGQGQGGMGGQRPAGQGGFPGFGGAQGGQGGQGGQRRQGQGQGQGGMAGQRPAGQGGFPGMGGFGSGQRQQGQAAQNNSQREKDLAIIKDNNLKQLEFTCDKGKIWFCEGAYNMNAEGKPAILLFLHGGGERGKSTDNASQVRLGLAAIIKDIKANPSRKVIVLAPQCPDTQTWGGMGSLPTDGSATIDMLPKLIQAKITEYGADADRVYITGFSMGGIGTIEMASRYPQLFAAAIPICCGGTEEHAKKLVNMPFAIFQGGADPVVQPARSKAFYEYMVNAGNKQVSYKEYPGVGHNSWDNAYADPATFTWLFSQKRK